MIYESMRVDISTGITESIILTDDEVRNEMIPYQLDLTSDKLIIANNGIDTAVVTVQLVTAPLADDTQENITQSRPVQVSIDGEVVNITLNADGTESINITSVDPDTASIVVNSIRQSSNELIIEVTNAS